MSPLLTWVACAALAYAMMTVRGYSTRALGFVKSDYDKRLKILTTVLAEDNYWKHVFKQFVFVDYHDHYHQVIIEQLMEGAKIDATEPSAEPSTEPSAESSTHPTRVAVKPLVFLRNLFLKGERYRVGSILKLAVEIVQNAFSCLVYKHTVHLLKVVRVEMSRTGAAAHSKASSWSRKAIPSLATMVMKMAELGYADGNILKVTKFFYVYQTRKAKKTAGKFTYTSALKRIADDMLRFVKDNCVKAPGTEKLIADELNVFHTSSLYNTGEARDLTDKTFKHMFVSANKKIESHVGAVTPYTEGMSSEMWNEFLHFTTDDYDDIEFVQINR